LHNYIEWILVRMKCPPSKRRVILAFYWYCMSYINTDGDLVAFLQYLSGIIQGCPLSGSVFALAPDPILRLLHSSLDEACRSIEGGASFVLRACADDIGASLSRMSLLKAMYAPFQYAEFGAGLKLKPKKCILAVAAPLTTAVKIRIKDFIVEHLPSWKDFAVRDHAKYLGFWLGPGADARQNFAAPAEKFIKRIYSISACPFSNRAGTIACNRDAVPTLTYVGQLIEPPTSLTNLQLTINSKVWKLPYRGLSASLRGLKHDLGIPVPFDIKLLCDAARVRTANRTLDGWRGLADLLKASWESFGGFSKEPVEIWWSPAHWKMKPIAQTLYQALPFDRYDDAEFSHSQFARLKPSTRQLVYESLDNQTHNLQSENYRALIFDQPNSHFVDFIASYNFRHFRKLNDERVNSLCDCIFQPTS
jgi:hypothetical protein